MFIPYFGSLGIGLLLILYYIIFLMFRSEGGGDFAVKGGEFGFELLQFIFLAPRFGDDRFELGNVGFEFGGKLLVSGKRAYLKLSIIS